MARRRTAKYAQRSSLWISRPTLQQYKMNRTSIVTALVLVIAACGGSDSDAPGATVVQGPDTSIKPLEREVLTETQPLVPEVEGNRFLVLNLHPARTSENGCSTMPVGTETYAQQRVHEAGIACEENDVVTWITGLAEGTDVRVLEMRGPNRLVVDVR